MHVIVLLANVRVFCRLVNGSTITSVLSVFSGGDLGYFSVGFFLQTSTCTGTVPSVISGTGFYRMFLSPNQQC